MSRVVAAIGSVLVAVVIRDKRIPLVKPNTEYPTLVVCVTASVRYSLYRKIVELLLTVVQPPGCKLDMGLARISQAFCPLDRER